MLKYTDSLGIERGISVSLSPCGKWINWTQWTPKKHTNGSTVQIPYERKAELVEMINNIEDTRKG